MKANEFFKKVGIEAVRSYVAAYEDALTGDLKRLVESHEWVGLCGGLEDARALAGVHNDVALFESIADVESCMEVAQ